MFSITSALTDDYSRGFVRIPVPQSIWELSGSTFVVQRCQHELIDRCHVMLYRR